LGLITHWGHNTVFDSVACACALDCSRKKTRHIKQVLYA